MNGAPLPGLTAALLFCAAIGPAQAQIAMCWPQHRDGCISVQNFNYAPVVRAEIKEFLGNEAGNFLYTSPKTTAFEDVADVLLSIPAEEPVTLNNGDILVASCRWHSCDEKGAIVLEPAGDIAAIGILNFQCGKSDPPLKNSCDRDYTLTIFLKKQNQDSPVKQELANWAKNKIAMRYTSPGMHRAELAHVEIHLR